MKEILNVRLPDLPGQVINLDIGPDEWFVAITATVERPLVGTGAAAFRRTVNSSQKLVLGWDAIIPMPVSCSYPLVRVMPHGGVLLVDARTDGLSPNAWFVNRHGAVTSAFNVGDGVEDVLAWGDRIVVTYFDEGVFSGIPPSHDGVAIFAADGSFESGYHTTFGHSDAAIVDCYAACIDEQSRLLLCPYGNFPVVRIDARFRTREVFQTPKLVHGAHAISARGDRVFFAGPLERRSTMFELVLGQNTVREVGEFAGGASGLPGGDFLLVDADGYRIISPE